MSESLGLGQLIPTGAAAPWPGRDAVHIAVVPALANETLRPGQHVGVMANKAVVVATSGGTPIGVVDPFLKKNSVNAGQGFWLYLYPGSITSLAHVWAHPVIDQAMSQPKEWMKVTLDKPLKVGMIDGGTYVDTDKHQALPKVVAAITRVKDFAEHIDQSYKELMAHADSWLAEKAKGGHPWTGMGSNDAYSNASSSQWQDFWKDYNIIRGKQVPIDTGHYFTCAC